MDVGLSLFPIWAGCDCCYCSVGEQVFWQIYDQPWLTITSLPALPLNGTSTNTSRQCLLSCLQWLRNSFAGRWNTTIRSSLMMR